MVLMSFVGWMSRSLNLGRMSDNGLMLRVRVTMSLSPPDRGALRNRSLRRGLGPATSRQRYRRSPLASPLRQPYDPLRYPLRLHEVPSDRVVSWFGFLPSGV